MNGAADSLQYVAPAAPVLVGAVEGAELTYTFGYAIDAGFYSSQPTPP